MALQIVMAVIVISFNASWNCRLKPFDWGLDCTSRSFKPFVLETEIKFVIWSPLVSSSDGIQFGLQDLSWIVPTSPDSRPKTTSLCGFDTSKINGCSFYSTCKKQIYIHVWRMVHWSILEIIGIVWSWYKYIPFIRKQKSKTNNTLFIYAYV